MTLIYRAIWQDAVPDVTSLTADDFQTWVTGKYPDHVSTLAADSTHTFTRPSNGFDEAVTVDITTTTLPGTPADRIGAVYRADLIEARDDTRWHTTVRAWEAPDDDGHWASWTWLDVEVVGNIQLSQINAAAPALARTLIAHGNAPRTGPTALAAGTAVVAGPQAATDLADWITDPARTTPLILIDASDRAADIADHNHTTLQAICDAVSRATVGIAVTYATDDATAEMLTTTLSDRHSLGRDFGIWGGVMRVYLPIIDIDSYREPARHRYHFPTRYATSPRTAKLLVANRLCQASALRPAPSSYADIKRRLDAATNSSDSDLLALADAALADATITAERLFVDITEQNDTIEELSFDYAVALETIGALQQENDKHLRHIASLQTRLAVPDDFTDTDPAALIPVSCSSPSEAVELARTHLSDRLIITDDACRDLEDLDAAVTATAWGQTAWAGFQALHAYATARADGWNQGGFWEWCATSGHRKAWPASAKKLSMRESSTVETRGKFRQARTFTVPTAYSADGTLYMGAHLKISEGGGNLAPRIYFEPDPRLLSDPKTLTNTVLVGFSGPHKHTPNTRK